MPLILIRFFRKFSCSSDTPMPTQTRSYRCNSLCVLMFRKLPCTNFGMQKSKSSKLTAVLTNSVIFCLLYSIISGQTSILWFVPFEPLITRALFLIREFVFSVKKKVVFVSLNYFFYGDIKCTHFQHYFSVFASFRLNISILGSLIVFQKKCIISI